MLAEGLASSTETGKGAMITTKINRPVFLDLFKIRLPTAGVLSIGHRISGVAMVFAIPIFVYLLDESLSGPEGFAFVSQTVTGWPFRLFLFFCLWALAHHFLAGIRYLLLDVAVGVEKPMFRRTAFGVLISAPVLALLLTGVLT